jgi:hypothetical protein
MTSEEKPYRELIPSEDGSRPRFVVIRSEEDGVQLFARRLNSRGEEMMFCFQLEEPTEAATRRNREIMGVFAKENIERSEREAQGCLKFFKLGHLTRKQWIERTQDELHKRCVDLAVRGVCFDQDEKEIARQIEARADEIWERPRLDLLKINNDLEAGRLLPDHRSMPTRVHNLFSQLHRWLQLS